MTLRIIVCPIDFSDVSAYAVDFARDLARPFGASLHLLHIVDEAYQYWMAVGPNSVPIGPPPEELVQAAREGMVNFVNKHFPAGEERPVTHVELGRPFLEIIGYALKVSADLILIGTHGRSGLSHVLLGSVTEKVVRKAECPVLTIRPPGTQFQAS